MGLISRLFLIYVIPLRLLIELFWAFIWSPKAKPDQTTSTANGKHAQENGDHQVDSDHLSGEKVAELNLAMDKWWGPTTPLAGLKAMNHVRVPIVIQAYQKDVLLREFDPSILKTASPLLGAKICDVGCGGGFLTEALQESGADVTGIDDNEIDVLSAQQHWKEKPGVDSKGPDYYWATVESFADRHAGEFDVVICSELLEHRDNPMTYLEQVLKLVRPGGAVVVTTNNRTLSALLFAIIWLEHIVAIIPVKTHHLYQFIKPKEIDAVFRRNGLKTTETIGYLPIGLTARLTWRLQWFLTSFTGVWYAQVASKPV